MKWLFLICFLVLSSGMAVAQSNEWGDDPYAEGSSDDLDSGDDLDWSWKSRSIPNAAPVPPTPVPIDGGVGFLLVAGGAYGLRQLKKQKKK
ncbi:MAG: PID-CTERM protein-sorting domain-containing protein [Flammeovirgaceae bacterium]